MRTFGLALRASKREQEGTLESSFRDVIDKWVTAKQFAAQQQGAELIASNTQVKKSYGSLTEYVLDQKGEFDGRWRTRVRLFELVENEPAHVTVEMFIDDLADSIAPVPVYVHPPRFLRNLRDSVILRSVDDFEVPHGLLRVTDPDALNLLVEEILSPSRRVPLVVVTDPVFKPAPVPDLGTKAANHLFGLARVVWIAGSLTFTFSERLGKELSVFDGGVRVYWPGFTTESAPRAVPLYLRKFMEEAGPNAEKKILGTLAQKLIAAATTRYREPSPIRSFFRRIEIESVQSAQKTQATLESRLVEVLQERDFARELEQVALAENHHLLAEKAELENELESTRHEVSKFKNLYALAKKGLGKAAAQHEEFPPADEWEAVEECRSRFSEMLQIPDDLHLETSLGPHVFDALKAMNEAVALERSGLMGDRRKAFAELFGKHLNHPVKYEPGDTGLQYLLDGKKVAVRERVHLKSGKPSETESIYWIPIGDVATRRYLVVRIGRHL